MPTCGPESQAPCCNTAQHTLVARNTVHCSSPCRPAARATQPRGRTHSGLHCLYRPFFVATLLSLLSVLSLRSLHSAPSDSVLALNLRQLRAGSQQSPWGSGWGPFNRTLAACSCCIQYNPSSAFPYNFFPSRIPTKILQAFSFRPYVLHEQPISSILNLSPYK